MKLLWPEPGRSMQLSAPHVCCYPWTPTHAHADESTTMGYVTCGLCLGYVAFFAIGAGPITWLYLSEILPRRIKGKVRSRMWMTCGHRPGCCCC